MFKLQLDDRNDCIFLILMGYHWLIQKILQQSLNNYDSHYLYLELSVLSVKKFEGYLANKKNFHIIL
jgi:hypothetical protein